MGSSEIALVAAVVLIPLAIAVAVTLWTLEPAARRAERAKRGRKAATSIPLTMSDDANEQTSDEPFADTADRDDRR